MSPEGPVLRDIHVPPAAWWPLAPGVWLLVVVLALCIAATLWWLLRRARRRPLVAALREVDRIAAVYAANGDAANVADGASRLLRRIACRIDPAAASQGGEAWRAFVHGQAPDAATRDALDGLVDARFRAHPEVDVPAVLSALRAWCGRALRPRGVRAARRDQGTVPRVIETAAAP